MSLLDGVSIDTLLLKVKSGRCSFENGKVVPENTFGELFFVSIDQEIRLFWSSDANIYLENNILYNLKNITLDLLLFPGDAVSWLATFNSLIVENDDNLAEKVNNIINEVYGDEVHDAAMEFVDENSPSTSQAIQLQTLQNILAGIKVPNPQRDISLSEVVTLETVKPILNDPDVIAALAPYLPEGAPATAAEIQSILLSPQYAQSLQSLTMALQSGQLAPLMAQFGK
ncbi:adhesion regulating molecule 1 [Nowakowskiella sp. JEL0078]|nr:adhesion regulating molecule 1 [Nowakowskiella sp. JEL0078]